MLSVVRMRSEMVNFKLKGLKIKRFEGLLIIYIDGNQMGDNEH